MEILRRAEVEMEVVEVLVGSKIPTEDAKGNPWGLGPGAEGPGVLGPFSASA